MSLPIRIGLFTLGLLSACASSSDVESSAADLTNNDHGAPSTSFPAFAPDHARVVHTQDPTTHRPGTVMTAPKLVTVTLNGDANADKLEAFGDKLGTSAYWHTVVSEYGVGPIEGGHHVRATIAYAAGKSSLADTDLEAWVVSQVKDAPANGWPENDGSTFYAVYVPGSLDVTSLGHDACAEEEGYHQEFLDTRYGEQDPKRHVVFSFVFEKCGTGTFANTTDTASHEIGEGVLDPHIQSDTAYVGFDDDHVALDVFQQRQNETGDACEWFDDSNFREGIPVGNPAASKNADARYTDGQPNFSYELQRLWSNASAAQGHNPCVPVADEPYYNLTPLALNEIHVIVPPKRITDVATKGYLTKPVKQADGTTAEQTTFSVGFFADRATEGTWEIEAMEGSPFGPAVSAAHARLTIAIDTARKDAKGKAIGENGEKAIVTVTVRAADPSIKFPATGILMTLTSKKDGLAPHYLPVLVQAPR